MLPCPPLVLPWALCAALPPPSLVLPCPPWCCSPGAALGLVNMTATQCLQVCEDGRGRFKTTSSQPARIADREKKAPLKS